MFFLKKKQKNISDKKCPAIQVLFPWIIVHSCLTRILRIYDRLKGGQTSIWSLDTRTIEEHCFLAVLQIIY